MPRPKTPLSKAKLTGAMAKDPQRYRGRSEPSTSGEPVGDPPKHLNTHCKDVWHDLVGSLDWLQREDRIAVEVAAIAIGQVRTLMKLGEPIPASLLAASNTSLGKLGATPTDRQKVAQPPDEPEDDPFARFDA
ncbi:hypothetical protein C8N31_10236 [Sulfitobacter mediterraneus]|uniref:Terminase n=2 Tax=Sulfitobacter mediterraneus TaxID=83219 RepID=A0A2T6CHF6_9RHOB|nr:hypothetical protein C8N31_10236 [Sulfitobacter mediterraneus]